MKHLHHFVVNKLSTKPHWGVKELKTELHTVMNKEAEERGKKLNKVTKIKKYDIIYTSLYGGVPHYIVVDKVVGNRVFGVGLTSTNGTHTLCEIKGDRLSVGCYFSNSYCIIDLETAKSSYVRTYENKTEANLVFKQLKQIYENLTRQSRRIRKPNTLCRNTNK